ncbi:MULTISPECIES: hypothetical protein [Protofrankia]|uniref:Uncharacterized protein n=1 Tax=Protofrankia coriariae TaxID=1562887 RepID=A0ABR5F3L4_9ACTN|nr:MULTISPECIES: hypothetical protein [Protofrankia]KLL11324.1 hypothetical protein FrCorBMG51_11940 [Protofrankia coriariae]ONH34869.1 hypothetical protein BL254_13940 [Protofrankia sp. BMG5.30]
MRRQREVDGVDLRVVTDGLEHRTVPGETFTFGRDDGCTVCLDPEDKAISRLAGLVEWIGEVWMLSNPSATRHFATVDPFGLRRVVGPGKRDPVEGRLRVIVDGAARSHELIMYGPPAAGRQPKAPTGIPTSAGLKVTIKDADRLALVALFAGYLQDGDRYDPAPRSYAAAAARLGWNRTTLIKRIEYLRTRLTDDGVPNLQGWNALSALAEYVLTTGLITPADLRLIGQEPGPDST